MSGLTEISEKVLSKINVIVYLANHYGAIVAIYDFLHQFVFRGNNVVSHRIERRFYNSVCNKLKTKYRGLISKWEMVSAQNSSFEHINQKSTIWIFWWQGFEDMPNVVRDCIASVFRNSDQHQVILLSESNYREYIELEDYIESKFRNGVISVTHLSDIIRAKLLYTYGGFWLDATVLLTESFPQSLYSYSFFTIKHGLFSNYHVCRGLWTGYFIAVSEGHPLMGFLSDAFSKYWETEDLLICYLLIDCFISIAFDEIPYLRSEIERVPVNNQMTYFLDDFGNDLFSESIWKRIRSSTLAFKMHRQRTFFTYSADKLTYYGAAIADSKRSLDPDVDVLSNNSH